jgi:hypothetical protein
MAAVSGGPVMILVEFLVRHTARLRPLMSGDVATQVKACPLEGLKLLHVLRNKTELKILLVSRLLSLRNRYMYYRGGRNPAAIVGTALYTFNTF